MALNLHSQGMRIQRKIHDREWEIANRLTTQAVYEKISSAQMAEIKAFLGTAVGWQNEHWLLHNFLNGFILLALFALDAASLLLCARAFHFNAGSAAAQVSFVLLASFLHGSICYSIIAYSLHEGAAHKSIIYVRGPLSRFAAFLAHNCCRVLFCDPIFYYENHKLHHQKYATRQDGAFSNFVLLRRILFSFQPLAINFNFTDYKIHRDMAHSLSRLLSFLIGASYVATYGYFLFGIAGAWYPILVLGFLGPWFGFILDRLRETSEHCLMPLDLQNSSRNLGLGFWGCLIGGGPWGQTCHLSHHLGIPLAWYNQVRLHKLLKERIFTEGQKKFFFVEEGFLGFPRFFLSLLQRVRLEEKLLSESQRSGYTLK